MYSETTRDIKVSVVPEFLEKNSNPNKKVFAFAYTVTIENKGSHRVQLLERHWIINSGGHQMAEVVGPGVVGEQPALQSGEAYQYSSSAVIENPFGSMLGSYTFRDAEGKFFEVRIPEFDLVYPMYLH